MANERSFVRREDCGIAVPVLLSGDITHPPVLAYTTRSSGHAPNVGPQDVTPGTRSEPTRLLAEASALPAVRARRWS